MVPQNPKTPLYITVDLNLIDKSCTVVGSLLNTHQHLLHKIRQFLPLKLALLVSFIIVHLGVQELPLQTSVVRYQVVEKLLFEIYFRVKRTVFNYELCIRFKQDVRQQCKQSKPVLR